MEKFIQPEDLRLLYVTAHSFPEGIEEAFTRLSNLLPSYEDRIHFGISAPEKDVIIYKAAASEAYEGETELSGLKTFVLTKGEYLTETVTGWRSNPTEILMKVFDKLLADPRLDTSFPCIEWYKGDDEVACMVRLADHQQVI